MKNDLLERTRKLKEERIIQEEKKHSLLGATIDDCTLMMQYKNKASIIHDGKLCGFATNNK